MGGAYVAKPADPAAIDVPPGWNPDWPRPGETVITWPGITPDPFFPAPLPPGYTPSYSLIMTATAEIAFDVAASVTGSLRDYDTYVTNEPDNSRIVWTAGIDGVAVQLKFTGGEFASSINSTVSYGTYWGATPSIEFDLAAENDGNTLELVGVSVIDGITVVQTKEIAITATASFTAPIEYTITDDFWWMQLRVTFGVFDYDGDENVQCIWSESWNVPAIREVNGVAEDYPYTIPALDGYITVTIDDDGVTASINYASIPDDKYLFVRADQSTLRTTASNLLTFIIGEDTYTKTLIDNTPVEQWLRVWNDGTVQVINP